MPTFFESTAMNTQYLDIFGDNATLTNWIVEIPRTGTTPVQKLNIFEHVPLATLTAIIEKDGSAISLLPTIPRNGVPQPLQGTGRKAVQVEAAYYAQTASVWADELQGQRGQGSVLTPDTVEALVKRRMAAGKLNIETSIAYQEFSALKGIVQDAGGTELVNLLALFGVAQPTQAMGLATDTTVIANLLVAAMRQGEDGLAGPTPDRWIGLASPAFLDKLRAHPSVREILGAWQGSAGTLAGDYRPLGAISLAGVDFLEVRSAPGAPVLVEPDACYLVPQGVQGMFQTYFAPAPRTDAVNQEGLPFYASAEALEHNRGFKLLMESCPIAINTRPGGVVKLTA